MKYRIVLILSVMLPLQAHAQKRVVKDILYCFNVSKSIGKTPFGVSAYTEFTVDHSPIAIGYHYSMLSFQYKPFQWLTASTSGGFTGEAGVGKWMHDVTFIERVPLGCFRLMFREKVVHLRNSKTNEHSGLARFRTQISYPIPKTALSPLIAQDTYFWSTWKRTSIFAGLGWQPHKAVSLTALYMASLMPVKTMHHLVVSTGFSF